MKACLQQQVFCLREEYTSYLMLPWNEKSTQKIFIKKVETENIVNVDTIKLEIKTDTLDKMDDTNGEINPYEIITNRVEKDNIIISQMEQWLTLSNIVNYVQYVSIQKIIMI